MGISGVAVREIKWRQFTEKQFRSRHPHYRLEGFEVAKKLWPRFYYLELYACSGAVIELLTKSFSVSSSKDWIWCLFGSEFESKVSLSHLSPLKVARYEYEGTVVVYPYTEDWQKREPVQQFPFYRYIDFATV